MKTLFVTSSVRDFSVSGLSFLCIYGTYVNGAYAAFINWGVTAELSSYGNDIFYNTSKIYSALLRSDQKAWLPGSKKAREAIAHELAVLIAKAFNDDFQDRLDSHKSETLPF